MPTINVVRILRKWCYGMLECLCVAPLLLVGAIIILPPSDISIWFVFFVLMILVGLVVRTIINSRALFLFLIGGMSVLLAILIFEGTFVIFVTSLIGISFAYRGGLYANEDGENLLPVSVIWGSVILYFLAYFFYRFISIFSPYTNIIAWLGILLIIITLFMTNSSHLNRSTSIEGKKNEVRSSLKWHNRFFIFFTILFIFFIYYFNVVKSLLEHFIMTIASFVSWLMSFVSFNDTSQEGPVNQDILPLIGEEEAPSSQFSIVEFLLQVFGYIIIISIILYLLYFIGKNIVRFFKFSSYWIIRLFNNLLSVGKNEEEEKNYIDEKESVINWKDWRGEWKDKLTDKLPLFRKRELKWKDLSSNREKIRFLYKSVVRTGIIKGYKFKSYLTPTETVAEMKKEKLLNRKESIELNNLYIKAKYSQEKISDSEVESMIDHFKEYK
ncbi:hypothetical protein [Evansella tamaricis]|uniref:DUF4129 domain-containing protein n=1 Tax=Evansella tamaricis TaxID=2069301 RepID=A0ABS6JIP3_9BACI|nr:hypothetical protein [Evansella tamaricis]MBU9713403.1 hypothetical protein [Evansella tamaricis]